MFHENLLTNAALAQHWLQSTLTGQQFYSLVNMWVYAGIRHVMLWTHKGGKSCVIIEVAKRSFTLGYSFKCSSTVSSRKGFECLSSVLSYLFLSIFPWTKWGRDCYLDALCLRHSVCNFLYKKSTSTVLESTVDRESIPHSICSHICLEEYSG